MGEGYVKLYRKLLDWEWYDNLNTKALFFHCLLKANFKQTRWRGEAIPKGSFVTSYEKLSNELGLSIQQIRTAMERLKSTHEITCKSTNKYTLIKVENWALYQEDVITNNTRNNMPHNKRTTNEQQTNNKQITAEEECKERKNVKNEKKKDIKASNDAMSVGTDAPIIKSTKIDFNSIADWWNTHSKLKEITAVTDKRKSHLTARIKEYGENAIYKAIDNVGTSKFLHGDNSKGWIATFDWVFLPNNFVKVLEGNYSDEKLTRTIYDDIDERVRKMNEYMGVQS